MAAPSALKPIFVEHKNKSEKKWLSKCICIIVAAKPPPRLSSDALLKCIQQFSNCVAWLPTSMWGDRNFRWFFSHNSFSFRNSIKKWMRHAGDTIARAWKRWFAEEESRRSITGAASDLMPFLKFHIRLCFQFHLFMRVFCVWICDFHFLFEGDRHRQTDYFSIHINCSFDTSRYRC